MPQTDISCRGLFGGEGGLSFGLLAKCRYPWEVLNVLGKYVSELARMLLAEDGWYELAEGVVASKTAVIAPSAVIVGPAVIGAGTEIRPGAYIRGNVLVEENCVIGNSTELKNSILMAGAKLPHFNYAGDSLIGRKAHMGAGAVASNFKLDGSPVCVGGFETGRKKFGAVLGDGAEVGCHCVLNPGTVIGRNTAIYPCVSVRGVIPENVIVNSSKEVISKK